MKKIELCEKYDLWTYLKNVKKPIVMYGMGNGADKIINICSEYGIEICDFFASDGFVRGHKFHNKTVLTYGEIKEKYQDFIVLLSFASSLEEVLCNIYKIAAEQELYVPDVPVFGNTLFNYEFCEENYEKFVKVYNLLADERSREVYVDTICAKLSGKLSYFNSSECNKDEINSSIIHPSKYKTYADLGAYNGDTIREILSTAPNIAKIYALEPDRRNFRKLNEYAVNEERCSIECHNCGAWSSDKTLYFSNSGNRNASFSDVKPTDGKIKEIEVRRLDSILLGRPVDYIKYDVEGAEAEAIDGSVEAITKHSPDLLISLYHRGEDLFTLPIKINEINPDYKLYLRRLPYLPAWDLNLYAIKE